MPDCEIPHCDEFAIFPLGCDHYVCGSCMLSIAKLRTPIMDPTVFDVCPICRRRSRMGDYTLGLLMNHFRPKKVMVMEVEGSSACCIVIQEDHEDSFADPQLFLVDPICMMLFLRSDMEINLHDKLCKICDTRERAKGFIKHFPNTPIDYCTGTWFEEMCAINFACLTC